MRYHEQPEIYFSGLWNGLKSERSLNVPYIIRKGSEGVKVVRFEHILRLSAKYEFLNSIQSFQKQ